MKNPIRILDPRLAQAALGLLIVGTCFGTDDSPPQAYSAFEIREVASPTTGQRFRWQDIPVKDPVPIDLSREVLADASILLAAKVVPRTGTIYPGYWDIEVSFTASGRTAFAEAWRQGKSHLAFLLCGTVVSVMGGEFDRGMHADSWRLRAWLTKEKAEECAAAIDTEIEKRAKGSNQAIQPTASPRSTSVSTD